MREFLPILIIFFISNTNALDAKREIIEWGAIGAMGTGAGIFALTGPFFDEPLIGGCGCGKASEETVPTSALYPACLGVAALAFVPNPNGENKFGVRYRFIKGYFETIAAERFVVCLAKDIAGSPRPNADERKAEGLPERDYRDSFPSGHASFAFANASYLSFYLWGQLGDNNDTGWLIAKSAISAGLASGAGWVAWTRVDNGVHRERDVIAGGAIGAAIGAGVYWFQSEQQNEKVSIRFTGNGAAIALSF